jgi:hypothetical protein
MGVMISERRDVRDMSVDLGTYEPEIMLWVTYSEHENMMWFTVKFTDSFSVYLETTQAQALEESLSSALKTKWDRTRP